MSAPLPALVDRKQLAAELGVTRAVVDRIFRDLAGREGVIVAGRKPLVERAAVARWIEEHRFRDGAGVR